MYSTYDLERTAAWRRSRLLREAESERLARRATVGSTGAACQGATRGRRTAWAPTARPTALAWLRRPG